MRGIVVGSSSPTPFVSSSSSSSSTARCRRVRVHPSSRSFGNGGEEEEEEFFGSRRNEAEETRGREAKEEEEEEESRISFRSGKRENEATTGQRGRYWRPEEEEEEEEEEEVEVEEEEGEGRWCSKGREEPAWKSSSGGCSGGVGGDGGGGGGVVANRGARFSSHWNEAWTYEEEEEEEAARNGTAFLPSLADETWKEVEVATNSSSGESRVAKVVADPRQTDFPSTLWKHEHGSLTTTTTTTTTKTTKTTTTTTTRSERRTRKKKKKKKRRACTAANNRSTYIQLALLLFLVAFGQCALRRSAGVLNNNNCSARPSTIGFSVLAIGTVISAVSAAPLDLTGDAGVRAERSANLSHITGASRKIQMYIKNRHLQILPDGTVNGSNDDTSDYTIFQRTSVSRGQLRIQGVATCLYLCMDSCGLLYGSREYTDDCVFNETLEQHNYNTYSSAKWSTAKKTLYLGLNRHGQPRRVQAKGHNLGRLSAYARVLTQVAPLDRVETLQRRMLGAQHNVRHRHNTHRGDLIQQSLCPALPAQEKDGRDKFRCRKRKKRKKRKRRCRPGEKPGPQCQIAESSKPVPPARNQSLAANGTSPIQSKRSCEGLASEEACRREALSVPSKKRKLRVEEIAPDGEEETEGREGERGEGGGGERGGKGKGGGGRNVSGSSNGKSKAPASNAKKVNAAGSTSKKPNLTNGKKRKKKGAQQPRRNSVGLGRKRSKVAATTEATTSASGTTIPTTTVATTVPATTTTTTTTTTITTTTTTRTTTTGVVA